MLACNRVRLLPAANISQWRRGTDQAQSMTRLEKVALRAYIMRMKNAHASSRQRLNLTLPGSLVEEAKALGLNLSRACETGLEAAVAAERARRWQAENRAFFDWYNAKVEKDGLLLAEYRQF
jgi:antitoxin CcdA